MAGTSHACERRTLASSSLVTVEACACGIVHISLAAITLRFEPTALHSLRDTLDDAARRLDADTRTPEWWPRSPFPGGRA